MRPFLSKLLAFCGTKINDRRWSRQFTHTSGESCIRAILLFEQYLLLLIPAPYTCGCVDVQIFSNNLDFHLVIHPIDLDITLSSPNPKVNKMSATEKSVVPKETLEGMSQHTYTLIPKQRKPHILFTNLLTCYSNSSDQVCGHGKPTIAAAIAFKLEDIMLIRYLPDRGHATRSD